MLLWESKKKITHCKFCRFTLCLSQHQYCAEFSNKMHSRTKNNVNKRRSNDQVIISGRCGNSINARRKWFAKLTFLIISFHYLEIFSKQIIWYFWWQFSVTKVFHVEIVYSNNSGNYLPSITLPLITASLLLDDVFLIYTLYAIRCIPGSSDLSNS